MEGLGVMEEMGELTRRGEAFALATVVWRQGPSSSQPGSRAIITAAGELHGWIGGACAEPVVIREAKQVMADGTARLLLLGTPEQFGGAVPDGMTVVPISCQSEGALQVYIEPVLPAPHLVVAAIPRWPGRWPAWPGPSAGGRTCFGGPDFTAGAADGRSMVVVATQGHGDEEVLEGAAAARPAYLAGRLATARRHRAGLPRGPRRAAGPARPGAGAGLDLGPTTHQEIAVAILAELVQLRASGALAGARAGTRDRACPRRNPARTRCAGWP